MKSGEEEEEEEVVVVVVVVQQQQRGGLYPCSQGGKGAQYGLIEPLWVVFFIVFSDG